MGQERVRIGRGRRELEPAGPAERSQAPDVSRRPAAVTDQRPPSFGECRAALDGRAAPNPLRKEWNVSLLLVILIVLLVLAAAGGGIFVSNLLWLLLVAALIVLAVGLLSGRSTV
jgi:hypothetical protein